MLPHKMIVKIARTDICEENFEAAELLVIAHKCGPKVDVTSFKKVVTLLLSLDPRSDLSLLCSLHEKRIRGKPNSE